MLRFYKDLIDIEVVDMATERRLGLVTDIVINPHDLSVGLLVCHIKSLEDDRFLLPIEVHKMYFNRLLIQSIDNLSELDDLVKAKQFVEINYQVIGKKVRTDSKKKVGVVNEFVIDDDDFQVKKLYVRPPITRFLQSSDLIIGRNQVVEVNDNEIIVRDGSIRSTKLAKATGDA